MRVQVRMPHALRVQPTDASTDRRPAPALEGAIREGLCQGEARRQFLGHEIGAIPRTRAQVTRGDGTRHRQAELAEPPQQPPLAVGARAIRSGPKVGVVDEPGEESATAIVPQHPALVAGGHEGDRATTTRQLLEGASCAPVVPLEEPLVRLVDARCIV